jgi:hypothetical protein
MSIFKKFKNGLQGARPLIAFSGNHLAIYAGEIAHKICEVVIQKKSEVARCGLPAGERTPTMWHLLCWEGPKNSLQERKLFFLAIMYYNLFI